MEEKTLTFEEKLSKLLELAKSKKNVLDEKEVLDAFAGEELTPEKLDRIYDFLDKKHVQKSYTSDSPQVPEAVNGRAFHLGMLILVKVAAV